MKQYIDKSALVVEIERRRKLVSDPILSGDDLMIGERNALFNLLSFINTLEVKEVDSEKEVYETAEAFAKIIRANLTGIDKDVQYKFEQLYKEITGKKMYQGYND